MSVGSSVWWERLERVSNGAFLLAGWLFALFAGFWGAFAFTELAPESVQNVLEAGGLDSGVHRMTRGLSATRDPG